MKPDPWYLENTVCPRHQRAFDWDGSRLTCPDGDAYEVVSGIPVLLVDDAEHTHESAAKSLAAAVSGTAPPATPLAVGEGIHPFVQRMLLATNGIMYESVRLSEYPIPEIRLPTARGNDLLLDIGCNWGRWCVAAGRRGYSVVGLDPSLEAVLAARSVTKQLGVDARFVVGDARFLPFRSNLFDVVFSYSVLQHFSKANVRSSLGSIQRILKADGVTVIQMLNTFGLRTSYNRARHAFAPPHVFDVRYWTPAELCAAFSETIGPAQVFVDGFFSANAQRAEAHLLPLRYRAVVHLSDSLRKLAQRVPGLAQLADSLYVASSRDPGRIAEVGQYMNAA